MNPNYKGVFLGATLLQQRGNVGGGRSVFVKLQGQKNDLVFPAIGGKLANPFKGAAKIFAGDLLEYRTNANGVSPVVYLLKTYKVKSMNSTTVVIYKDGFKHVPFVGDVLMKAPSVIGGTGKAYAVTAVTVNSDGNWQLTFGTAIDNCADGDILVEAEAASATGTMLVKNINAVAPCDYDCLYEPATGDNDFDGARYLITPALHALMYVSKMSPIPACANVYNKCNVNGWFEVDFCNKIVDSPVLDAFMPVLTGTSAPTTATVGRVGQFYLLTTSGSEALYVCTAVTAAVGETPASYNWESLTIA